MNYRNVVIQDNLDISTASTTTYDLNLVDPISRLGFKFNLQNHATTPVIVAHPARAVTKIELIDGSHIIAAVSGEQLLSMNYYDNMRPPNTYVNGVTGTQSYFTAHLDFGRWLWDNELCFDPKRYSNPQLRITYNKALYESSAAYMWMTILADVFDGKSPSPRGYLKRHEISTWTPAASAETRLDLPTDYPIRAAFFTGYATDAGCRSQIDYIKISEDTDKKVPINIKTRHLFGQIMSDYPAIYEPVIFVGAAATEVVYTMPSNESVFTCVGTLAPDNWLTSYNYDKLTMDATSTGNRVEGHAIGWIPFHTFPLYFGMRDDPGDWYDPVRLNIKKLEAIPKGASSVGTSPVGRLFVEQLVPF